MACFFEKQESNNMDVSPEAFKFHGIRWGRGGKRGWCMNSDEKQLWIRLRCQNVPNSETMLNQTPGYPQNVESIDEVAFEEDAGG